MSIFDLYKGIYSIEKKEKKQVIPPRAMEAVEWLRKGYKIPQIAEEMGITEKVVRGYLLLAKKAGVIKPEEYYKGYVPNWLWKYAVSEFPLPTWEFWDELEYTRQLGMLAWKPLSNELTKPIVRDKMLTIVACEGHLGFDTRDLSPIMTVSVSEREFTDYCTELWGVSTIEKFVKKKYVYVGTINGLKVTILCKDWHRLLGFRKRLGKWIYERVGFKATPEQFEYFKREWGWIVRKEKARIAVPVGSGEVVEFIEEEVEVLIV